MIKKKYCPKCDKNKFISQFYKAKGRGDSLAGWCKLCELKQEKKYRARPEIKIKKDKYHKEYRARMKKLGKDPVIAAARKEKQRKYYKKNRIRILKNVKRFNQKVKSKLTRNKRMKIKRQTDPKLKLSENIFSSMRYSLKTNRAGKKWQASVGYSINELKAHLEKKFKNGLTWKKFFKESYHLDHIKPISSFNYTKPEDKEFKQCWALSNLRVMKGVDNMRKGSTYKGRRVKLIKGN